MSAKIWFVGAGKGGVGKTFIASSLGITLAKLNYKVLLIDFDLNGANLHSTFGKTLSDKNIRHYFEAHKNINELISETQVPKLHYVQGYWDSWSTVKLTAQDADRLVQDCRNLPYDYVVFEAGVGADYAYLNIFDQADNKMIITNSEPASVEKTYRFIEAYLQYAMNEKLSPADSQKFKQICRDYKNLSKTGPINFKKYLEAHNFLSQELFISLFKNPIRLVVNGARNHQDHELGYSMKSVIYKYYDIQTDFVGSIDFDNAVWQSARACSPVLIERPYTPLSGEFLNICKYLCSEHSNASSYKAAV